MILEKKILFKYPDLDIASDSLKHWISLVAPGTVPKVFPRVHSDVSGCPMKAETENETPPMKSLFHSGYIQ